VGKFVGWFLPDLRRFPCPLPNRTRRIDRYETRTDRTAAHGSSDHPTTPTQFNAEHDCVWGIEGWTLRAAGHRRGPHTDAYTEAARLLGLSRKQADRIFIESRWPRRFRDRYVPEPSSPAEFQRNARIAAARIQHFIEVGA
jgi:hypothetical protein